MGANYAKKGISLIMLVITIIVIILLAGAIILSLSQNNPLNSASEANFKNNSQSYNQELTTFIAGEYVKNNGNFNPTTLSATKDTGTYKSMTIKQIITSMTDPDTNNFEIQSGKLAYVGTSNTEIIWASAVGIQAGSATQNQNQSSDLGFDTIVAGSSNTTYWLMADGTVKAWGDNDYGKIGDGTTYYKHIPVTIPGLSNVKQVSAGQYNAAVLLNDGTVMAWGYNGDGQLGDGTYNDSYVPVEVPGLSDVKQLAVGYDFTLALLNDGTVKGWEYNGYGQLGDGTTSSSNTPVTTLGLSNVKQIFAGDGYAMALLNDGTVKAWGFNGNGQIGDGTNDDKMEPTTVQGLNNVKQISINEWACFALLNDGTVMVWGDNMNGQFGNGVYGGDSNVPIAISGLSNVKQISSGYYHALALLNDGTVKAWGYNGDGELGNGTYDDILIPTQISSLSNVIEITAGPYGTYALLSNGTVMACGDNWYGELGIGTEASNANVPTLVMVNDTNAPTVAFSQNGGDFCNVSVSSNDVGVGTDYNSLQYVWSSQNVSAPTIGWNSFINYGAIPRNNPNTTEYLWIKSSDYFGNTSITKSNLFNTYNYYPVSIVTGAASSFAIMSDGTLRAWGENNLGQLGDGTNTNKNLPVAVKGVNNVVQVASSGGHALALLSDGTVMIWGVVLEQFSNGMIYSNTVNTPKVVQGLSNVKYIGAGYFTSYAILQDGTVKVWGENADGQIGNGTTQPIVNPTTVNAFYGAKQISGGHDFTVALMSDGTLKSCGSNDYGRLGNTNYTWNGVTTPVDVMGGLNTVRDISVGYGYTLALLQDNTVWGWGVNLQNQIGIGAGYGSAIQTPINIASLSNIKQVSAGTYHSLAVLHNGTLKTWGDNYHGQLGDGTTNSSNTPITVSSISNARAVSAGLDYFSIVLVSGGKIMAFGSNWSGALGDGTNIDRYSPVELPIF